MAARFETTSFIANDPVQFPKRYYDKRNIEVVALFTAIISWGNRKQIIQDCNKMFMRMGVSPFDYIMNWEWDNVCPDVNFHRTFFGRDFIYICRGLEYFYHRGFSLQDIKHDNVWQWIERLQYYMIQGNDGEYNKHIAPKGSRNKDNSPCKRLNLFLRWMVRTGSPVDLGIWSRYFNPSELIIPLDVHVATTARELGLCDRKSNDRAAAEIITNKLRGFDANDPCKYDFALFGIGESQKHVIL